MEHDVRQLRQPRLQRRLPVLLPEEFRVAQAGRQHLAVARDNRRAAVRCLGIGDAHERRGEFPRRVRAGEIFLVHPHGELDHLGRHVEEGRVECAEQRHRPFSQAHIFDQQPFVWDQRQLGRPSSGLGALLDQRGPVLRRQDDMRGAQLISVGHSGCDFDDAAGQEPMALGGTSRRDAFDFDRHNIAVEQRDDRMQRPHPAQRPAPPAHRLGPGEVADDCRNDAADHIGGRLSGPFDDRIEEAALGIVAFLQLLAGQAGGFQEALNRLRRRVGARAAPLLRHRRRCERQATRDQCEAARGNETLRGLGRDARLGQRRTEQPRQIRRRLPLHPRGDFLGEEFEQEISHAPPTLRRRPWSAPAPGRYRPAARRPR